MNKIFDRGIVSPPETYDQALDLCGHVHEVEAADVVQIEQTQWGDQLLVFLARPSGTPRPYYGFVTDRQALLELARHILRTLDPSPEEQILDELKAIRGVLEKKDCA